jgi:hypothetical protein
MEVLEPPVIVGAGGPCICPSAGWCQRHRMVKDPNRHTHCRTRSDYRELWDKKAVFRDPEAPEPYRSFLPEVMEEEKSFYKRVGLGDLFAAMTKVLGITPCGGCTERRRRLNKYRIKWPRKIAPQELNESIRWVDDHGLPKNYGTPTPKWAVAMTTAPRKTPQVLASLKSLCLSGFTDVRLIAEPGSEAPGNAPGVLVNDRTRGVFQNWRFALETVYREKPDALYFAVFQDDIRCSLNLREFLERDLWFDDHIGFVSPYCSAGKSLRVGPKRRRRVVWRSFNEYMDVTDRYRTRARRGGVPWGALSYIFPKESVELILNDRELAKQERMIDLRIHPVLSAHNRHMWFYNPSLVDHRDGESSIGHGQGRGMRSDSFRGEDFDAMSLLEGD